MLSAKLRRLCTQISVTTPEAFMSVFSIAVDLGGTNLRIAAVSEDGKLIEKVTTGTEVQKGRDFVIREMCDAIQSLTAKHQGLGRFAGIGIGVPGFIDMDTGT